MQEFPLYRDTIFDLFYHFYFLMTVLPTLRPSHFLFFQDPTSKSDDHFITGSVVVQEGEEKHIARGILYHDDPEDPLKEFKLVFPQEIDLSLVMRIYSLIPSQPVYTLITVESTQQGLLQSVHPTLTLQECASSLPPHFLLGCLNRFRTALTDKIASLPHQAQTVIRRIRSLAQPDYLKLAKHPLIRNRHVSLYTIEGAFSPKGLYYKESIISKDETMKQYRLLPYSSPSSSPVLITIKKNAVASPATPSPVFDRTALFEELEQRSIPFLPQRYVAEYCKQGDTVSSCLVEEEKQKVTLETYLQGSASPQEKACLIQKILQHLALLCQTEFVPLHLSYHTIFVQSTANGIEPLFTDLSHIRVRNTPLSDPSSFLNDPLAPPHIVQALYKQTPLIADAMPALWFALDLLASHLFNIPFSPLSRKNLNKERLNEPMEALRQAIGQKGASACSSPLLQLTQIMLTTAPNQWPTLAVLWDAFRSENRKKYPIPPIYFNFFYPSQTLQPEFKTVLIIRNLFDEAITLPLQIIHGERTLKPIDPSEVQCLPSSPDHPVKLRVSYPSTFLKNDSRREEFIARIRNTLASPLCSPSIAFFSDMQRSITVFRAPLSSLQSQALSLPAPILRKFLLSLAPFLRAKIQRGPSSLEPKLYEIESLKEWIWTDTAPQQMKETIFCYTDRAKNLYFCSNTPDQTKGLISTGVLTPMDELNPSNPDWTRKTFLRMNTPNLTSLPQDIAAQKKLLESMHQDASISGFLREQQIPHILQTEEALCFGAHNTRDICFLKEIHDQTLEAYLSQQPPYLERLHLARQLAETLSALHERQIFHYRIQSDSLFIVRTPRGVELRLGRFQSLHCNRFSPPIAGDLSDISASSPELRLHTLSSPFVPYTDLWQLGDMLSLLLFQESFLNRYELQTTDETVYRQNLQYMSRNLGTMSPPIDPLAQLIHRLLSKNPMNRPLAKEAFSTLLLQGV